MRKSSKVMTGAALSALALAFVLSACSSPTPAATVEAPTTAPTEAVTPTVAATEAATATQAMTEAATATQAMTEAATATEAMTEAATATEAMTEAAGAPAVTISDQKLASDNSLTVDKVIAAVDGWIVIHADNNGAPGTVLGHAAVKAGENDSVKVTLDDVNDLGTVAWAMLHIDAGTMGTYEFPGADVPVKDASGNIVMMKFNVTK